VRPLLGVHEEGAIHGAVQREGVKQVHDIWGEPLPCKASRQL
jgi:hypothetical protein